MSLPLPLPLPLSILSRLPYPLPILCSRSCPDPCLTALRVLLTLAIVVVIVIARMALSTAQRSVIGPVLIVIILATISSQFSGLMARESPGLYRRQLGG